MKTLIAAIIATALLLSNIEYRNPDIPTTYEEFRKGVRIDYNNLPFKFKDEVGDKYPILVELGTMLYQDGSWGAFGNVACSDCHGMSNHLAPEFNNQFGFPAFTNFDGERQFPEYLPPDYNLFDGLGAVNTPQGENSLFKAKLLSDLSVNDVGQAMESKGFFAHNQDWTKVAENDLYLEYAFMIWGECKFTERRVTMALVAAQNQSYTDKDAPIQKWARNEAPKKMEKFMVTFFDSGCANCHFGKDLAGEGQIMGNEVVRGHKPKRQLAVRSPLNNDCYTAIDRVGWQSDYTDYYWYLNKHAQNENLDIDVSYFNSNIKKWFND